MAQLADYLSDEIYLFVLISIMMIAGMVKQHQLFAGTYGVLKARFGSNRVVIMLMSMVSGILPIEGRAIVSAGMLDTATSSCNCVGHEHHNPDSRKKLGIIDFLTTHHFYMWSPIEKPVLLPMAAFGLGYAAWLGLMWPLITISLAFIMTYSWLSVREDEIEITAVDSQSLGEFAKHTLPFIGAIVAYMALGGEGPGLVFPIFGSLLVYYCAITGTWQWRQLAGYVNWGTVAVVAVVFATSGWMQEHRSWFEDAVRSIGMDMHTPRGVIYISLLTFIASFSMGSDGKFAALTVLMASAFGREYLVWFFALDYCGYLLTPMHECVLIGKRYFGTSLITYYTALIAWAALLLITAGLVTWG
jgi:uncharacterized protein